jgi:hypothetical protein
MPQVPTGPVMYGNQGVPGAVTVVPRDVLVKRQPVSRAVIDPRGVGSPAQPWVDVAPPTAPAPRVGGSGNGPPQRAPLPARRDPRESSGPRETRPPDQVGPPVETRSPPQRVPPAERVAPPPVGQTTTTAPPVRRVDPAPGADHRGNRPAPADAPVHRENGRSERPARPVMPVPGVFGPTAPVAPAPTGPAAARPATPAVVPAPPPAAAPTPPPKPVPADPPRERDDERKRIPESRQNPRENLR